MGKGSRRRLPSLVGRARQPVSFLLRFLRLAGPYWTSKERLRAGWLTAALVALTVGQVGVPIAINLWSARLFNALEQREMEAFLLLVGALGGILLANMLITTTHLRVKRQLQLRWRRWLTRRLLGEWMAKGRHLQINYLPGAHDNPDGRIAEDVRITTEVAIDLAHSLLYCLLLLVGFTQILWSLSGTPEVRIGDFEIFLPGHLVWIAILYAGTGTTVALLLGRPLVRAMDRRQAYEADFRFGLAHARENAEAVAVLRGEPVERRRLADLFKGVEAAWRKQTRALSNLFLFTTAYSVLSVAFPIVVAAPRYIGGTITLGALMQTAQAFQQMTAALSWPIDNLAAGATWRASVERVLGLHDALAELATRPAQTSRESISVERQAAPILAFRALTIADPDGSVIVDGLDAEIARGERVLVTGDPAATHRLFKVVAGLWSWGHGRVDLPRDAAIFFLPQRPYLPVGTLRTALAYPSPASAFAPTAAEAALRRVGLGYLTGRLSDVQTWERILAPGEQQRLGFARLLLHRPDWILIEDATDDLEPAGEEEMMRLLDQELPDATVITIGHHPILETFHRRKLALTSEQLPVA
ncbi:MAG: ABC transporter ATP-binding protein/permease [Rhodospirillales bacterium]|nr:ABC transporter ATP-binding protein/permease [Rhodospirillales bacterium]